MTVAGLEAVGGNPYFTASEKAVLGYLAWKADESGVCWPSIQEIQDWTGFVPNTIRFVLRRLESHSYLARRARPGKRTQYELHLEILGEKPWWKP